VRLLGWREAARADLLAIIDYISDDNPEAAQRLKDEIEAKVAKLPERPKLYPPGRVAGTRERSCEETTSSTPKMPARCLSGACCTAAQQWPPVQR
jgi:toxin ParE1/3/4